MPCLVKIKKIGGSTWFVYDRATDEKVGSVNYPGNDPNLNYHAVLTPGHIKENDLGHFATLDEAAIAIGQNAH